MLAAESSLQVGVKSYSAFSMGMLSSRRDESLVPNAAAIGTGSCEHIAGGCDGRKHNGCTALLHIAQWDAGVLENGANL